MAILPLNLIVLVLVNLNKPKYIPIVKRKPTFTFSHSVSFLPAFEIQY
jgi:hypothetical protein